MTPRKQQEIPGSEVAEFYTGKTLLITGAAGFLGTILLEILLRCCSGIQRIYILLRAKRGVLPEDRKTALFNKEIFYKVKEKDPGVMEKVTVIPGDVSKENLGMTDEDFRKVSTEVSIVFHIAAAISFLKPLRYILTHNVIATYNIIEFCRKLKHVDALVYTSTVYSNCNRKVIEEMVYKMPFKVKYVLETIRKGSDEELEILFGQCTPKFPNFYTFSKCLAENLLAETAADLPVSIVRPSLITCTWKGSLPGYIEDGSGFYSLIMAGVMKGFVCVMHTDKHLVMDHVPADIVGNTHVVAAWRQVTERLISPSVYNCTSSDIIHCTWDKLFSALVELSAKHPVPNSYQRSSLKLYKSSVAYRFHSILDHYIPAIVIDTLLWLRGRKPRLVKLYRFYDKMMSLLQYFQLNQWKIQSTNFQYLDSKLNFTDSEMFPVDIREYNLEQAGESIPTGSPMYKWESDKKSYEERMRITYIRYLQTSIIKWSFLGLSTFLVYLIFKRGRKVK